LQGCPLSGTLFVFAIDPLLYKLRLDIEDTGLGHIRACADDVGICLYKLMSLKQIFNIFDAFRLLSGLSLKPIKSIIVLLACLASKHNCEQVRGWLLHNIPNWVDMSIVNHAKYLGILLGPSAGEKQWDVALRKFRDRVSEIHQRKSLCLLPRRNIPRGLSQFSGTLPNLRGPRKN
jgi:hypothetical protein